MRDVCQVDVIDNTKIKQLALTDAAAHVFENFRGCRVLNASRSGSSLRVSLLLPEIPGGYHDAKELKGYVELGLSGRGVVLVSVHGLREATPGEVLARTLARKLP